LRGIPTTADAVEEAIKRQADMGVDEFILRPCAEDLDQMERLAELVGRLGAADPGVVDVFCVKGGLDPREL
jgi:hypothetical protein